jgi:hypothetical protein
VGQFLTDARIRMFFPPVGVGEYAASPVKTQLIKQPDTDQDPSQ